LDENYNAKLSDFGINLSKEILAKLVELDNDFHFRQTNSFSFYYTSPE